MVGTPILWTTIIIVLTIGLSAVIPLKFLCQQKQSTESLPLLLVMITFQLSWWMKSSFVWLSKYREAIKKCAFPISNKQQQM